MSKIAVIYWSGTGNTQQMAEAIANQAHADLFAASEFSPEKAANYDAFAFGCSAMGAEQLEEDEFEPMFASCEGKLGGKRIALFGSYGWGDGEWMRTWEEDVANIWGLSTDTLPLLCGAVVLILLAATLFSWWLTRRMVQPINHLAEHLDTIEADVPYEELIPLARTIQTDRKLREDNETMRREFTANVSHELKTPLTSISGYAELIETGMAKPADVPTFAARIHKEAQRMIALVSDILQLSELDSTQASHSREPVTEMAPVDLAALVKETAQNMTVNARRAYVTLQYDARPATVRGSRDQLSELTQNLCDNAIRYNRPGGHVELRCGVGGDGCPYFEVEDNGIGIPQDSQTRVFERFYRVDKSRSKATGGTGLGLAIVKHIALLHDAKIDLQSQVGTGTTIRVTFPKNS